MSVVVANPCDTCDGTRFHVIYAHHPILDGPLVRCDGCGLVQVNPPAGRYHVVDFVGRDAHADAYRRQASRVLAELCYRPDLETAERGVRERFWIDRLARLERVASHGRLLEVGGDGQFLPLAAARGWSVSGVQPDPGACARARELDGVHLLPTTLHEAGFAESSFDAVTMFHVIEHVPAPRSLCREAFRLLRPGGVLMVETPSIDTRWYRVLGRRWRQFIPDHYWFFAPATLWGRFPAGSLT